MKCSVCKKRDRAVMNKKTGKLHSWCNHCLKIRARKYRQENSDYYAALQKRQRRMRKKRVIDHYGGVCACCGESHIELLSIDHEMNNGAEHRRSMTKEYGMKHRGGDTLYKWIVASGFPKKGFRVLCFNCNASIGFYGYCPHSEKREWVEDVRKR